MSLAEALIALKPLVADPDANWSAIVRMLEENQELAEYEVLRFYVVKAVGGSRHDALLRSVDPDARLAAVKSLKHIYPRSVAARAIRSVIKDPDRRVRSHARHVIRALEIADVSLPDTRYKPRERQRIISTTPGAWNPTGWSFGVYAKDRPSMRMIPPGLPKLERVADIAALLGLASTVEIDRLMRPGARRGSPYVEFEIPKKSGGARKIAAPRAPLKRAQRKILEAILSKVPLHDACHGFVPGRSIVTNAEPHIGAALILKIDLLDFFPSIHYRRIEGLFRRQCGYSASVAGILAALTTHRALLDGDRIAWPGVMPQGAPTSPAIANIIARRLDARLFALAKKAGATYTRYADDLTFSFARPPESKGLGRFIWWVNQICQQEGFLENAKKRRVMRRSGPLRVAGVVVNSGLFVPREARRRFRAILANCKKNGVSAESRGRANFPAYLRGFAAYVKMVQPELGRALVEEVRSLLSS